VTERIIFTVAFYLKPHLHDLVVHLNGAPRVDMTETNPLGCMALACMTVQPYKESGEPEQFRMGRKKVEGRITLRSGERRGLNPHRMAHFEFLVEHLFYTMMLTYVDAKIDEGVSQNEAIRRFLGAHDIHSEAVHIDSFKKTITRRRKKVGTSTLPAARKTA
jgi:hypothetical protein